MRRVARALATVAGVLLGAASAHAQAPAKELQVQRGPTSELYIRKRPIAPEAPVLNAELKQMLVSTETRRDAKRTEAIGLLRAFLQSTPAGDGKAEGMFKLAELLWEESRRVYIERMEDFSRAIEKCNQATAKSGCVQPTEPRIELKEAEVLYLALHDQFPRFRRMDLVTYLIGFAAKEDEREDQAMASFQEVIAKFPQSPLYGDAWMMVGEHYFAAAQWQEARDAYGHIGEDAATNDLATFKIAWCEWKLGDTLQAAKDFKRVLDKAVAAERTGTEAQRRRSASLRDEALEYLVVVFTEDRSVSAKEVFDFLASIGGEQYSRDVLLKVAESYSGQGEWERSNESYRFLIKMDPEAMKSAEYQRDIIGNWNSAVDVEHAQDEIGVLLANFGPTTEWAKQQKNRDALTRSLAATEELVRTSAIAIHGEAQRREKADKKIDVALYTRAAAAYAQYLSAFGTGKQQSPKAVETRYYRADILFFKLGKTEEAGDEYLAVGKSAPVGPLHKDALLNAMAAYEKARPKDLVGRKQLVSADKKFGEAIDLYATLFPADPQLVGVIFKNGQMFYDYGEYDEAIKRFGVIVTKYPQDPNAGPAGDRILSALNKAQDYENIETWARKLKAAPSFAAKDQQERLAGLIVDSIRKSGDKYADAGKYEQAATFYLRVPKETTDTKVAAQSLMNAGVMYEKAKLPEKAADLYIDIAKTYGEKQGELGEKAAFSAGQVYEKVIYFDKAAAAYELVWSKFRTGTRGADALYNAGLLRQALGQNKEAIAHYQEYASKFRERKDAPDVAFNIGVVYEGAGDDGPAYKAYSDYARTYRSSGRRVVEAWTRAGRTSIRLGQQRRAKDELAMAQKLWKSATGTDKALATPWAAEARYLEAELIFAEFQKVTLDVPPKQLQRALKQKSKLLGDAEAAYASVVDYQDLKWATAALFRVGQVYDGFADSLLDAADKPPADVKPDEQQAYSDAINEYVVQVQDKAIELYTAGYSKAIQMQVYDEYTAKIRAALSKVAPKKFPPERESRARERIGDRAPTPELVTEIAR